MTRISYLNGKFLPHDQAFVHIEDRGFQLSDGIYEVVLFKNNRLIDADWHFERLQRSAAAIELRLDKSKTEINEIFLRLFKENKLTDGFVYLQITRGSSPRNQAFPKEYTPSIIATVSPSKYAKQEEIKAGFSAITYPDIRWGRCDIKSISLLAGTLAKQKAATQNACEAILIKDGFVTEGSFSNAFIVDEKGVLITRNADSNILSGITRNRIIAIAKENGIEVIERKFSEKELFQAAEVFVTSSTLLIRPISKIDNKTIGNGKCGAVTAKITKLYDAFIA
ncbi:MAG: D-amino-acid transaminase [Proteobacteria bacterium]|nr:D-amino-acid transaminase [Pseudomonadota bacterium]